MDERTRKRRKRWDETAPINAQTSTQGSQNATQKTGDQPQGINQKLLAAKVAAARINANLHKSNVPTTPQLGAATPAQQAKLAAKQQAERINQMLAQKGHLQPKALSAAGDIQVKQVVINDLENKELLLRKAFQTALSQKSGCSVTTRGQYVPPGSRGVPGTQLLHLLLAGAGGSVNKAVSEIEMTLGYPPGTLLATENNGVIQTVPNAPVFQSVPSAPQSTQGQVTIHIVVSSVYQFASPPKFNIAEKIQGPQGSFLSHVASTFGMKVCLVGEGSGDGETGPLKVAVTGLPHLLAQAKTMICDLIKTVLQEADESYVPPQEQSADQSQTTLQGPPPGPHPPLGPPPQQIQALPQHTPSQSLQQPEPSTLQQGMPGSQQPPSFQNSSNEIENAQESLEQYPLPQIQNDDIPPPPPKFKSVTPMNDSVPPPPPKMKPMPPHIPLQPHPNSMHMPIPPPGMHLNSTTPWGAHGQGLGPWAHGPGNMGMNYLAQPGMPLNPHHPHHKYGHQTEPLHPPGVERPDDKPLNFNPNFKQPPAPIRRFQEKSFNELDTAPPQTQTEEIVTEASSDPDEYDPLADAPEIGPKKPQKRPAPQILKNDYRAMPPPAMRQRTERSDSDTSDGGFYRDEDDGFRGQHEIDSEKSRYLKSKELHHKSSAMLKKRQLSGPADPLAQAWDGAQNTSKVKTHLSSLVDYDDESDTEFIGERRRIVRFAAEEQVRIISPIRASDYIVEEVQYEPGSHDQDTTEEEREVLESLGFVRPVDPQEPVNRTTIPANTPPDQGSVRPFWATASASQNPADNVDMKTLQYDSFLTDMGLKGKRRF